MRSMMAVPRFTTLAIRTEPPMRRTKPFTVASPRPCRAAFRRGTAVALGSLGHGGNMARRTQGCDMSAKADLAMRYRRRAEDVRTIAQGLYDDAERKILMDVVDDYEQWALVMTAPGTLNLRHFRLVVPN